MLSPQDAYIKARTFEHFTALHVKKRTLPSIYIRHVCCFLQEHQELLTQPDYKEMYDILMNYLLAYNIDLLKNDEMAPRDEQEYRELSEQYIDFLTALSPKDFKRYPKSEIDAYIAHFKKHSLI